MSNEALFHFAGKQIYPLNFKLILSTMDASKMIKPYCEDDLTARCLLNSSSDCGWKVQLHLLRPFHLCPFEKGIFFTTPIFTQNVLIWSLWSFYNEHAYICFEIFSRNWKHAKVFYVRCEPLCLVSTPFLGRAKNSNFPCQLVISDLKDIFLWVGGSVSFET